MTLGTALTLIAIGLYLGAGIVLAVLDHVGSLIEALDLYSDHDAPEATFARFVKVLLGWPFLMFGLME
ncbi:MAG: hypothetical protein ACO1RT_10245 [Planctomycetaceae bacterium]